MDDRTWDKSQGFDRVQKGDKYLEFKIQKMKEEAKRQAEIKEKLEELARLKLEEKKRNSLRAKLGRFFVGPNGLLRKDINPFKRRARK